MTIKRFGVRIRRLKGNNRKEITGVKDKAEQLKTTTLQLRKALFKEKFQQENEAIKA